MNDTQRLHIALGALRKIARCNESDCERYVAKVDAIAVEALVMIAVSDGDDETPLKARLDLDRSDRYHQIWKLT